MRLNPEFCRYLWLELSTQRLIALPLVLAAIFWLTWLTSEDPLRNVTSTALILFYLGTLLWGCRLAGASVVGELRDATWDWQRMSSIRPWSMTWAKLLGSTVFVWLGALICLLVYALASIAQGHGGQLVSELAVVVMIGLLAQSVTLAVSLLWLRRTASPGRGAVVTPQVFGLLAGLLAVFLWGDLAFAKVEVWGASGWYGMTFEPRLFFIASLAIFLGWSYLAAGRLMQAELQVRQRPWAWPAFTIFLMIYLQGFLPHICRRCSETFAGNLALPFVVAVLLAYLALFIFPKQPVQWRALSLALRTGAWSRALHLLPHWAVALAIALIVGFALATALTTRPETGSGPYKTQSALGILAIIAFMLRDVAIVLLLNVGGRLGRGDMAAAIYLLLLHAILPGILLATLGPPWSGLTSGFVDLGFTAVILDIGDWAAPGNQTLAAFRDLPTVALIGGSIQAVVLLFLLWRRWAAFQAAFEQRVAPGD